MVGMIAASGLVKSIFAFTAGGWKFGSRVGIGHAAMVAAAVAAVMLFPGAAPPAFR